jgi:hypothetical protein
MQTTHTRDRGLPDLLSHCKTEMGQSCEQTSGMTRPSGLSAPASTDPFWDSALPTTDIVLVRALQGQAGLQDERSLSTRSGVGQHD